eukprot:m.143396 g.143396  ORF g.143396 m.143396 type:complete len:136 (-) comp17164_c0_seq1:205-612(-)
MLRWLRQLPLAGAQARRLVGRDMRGNEFYEIPQGDGQQPRRMVLSQQSEVDTVISPAWTAWLRGARADAPQPQDDFVEPEVDPVDTIAEQLAAFQNVQEGRKAVHAAEVKPAKVQKVDEPTTASGTFQPGSWKPS